jgi:hypothetical protein
MAELKPGGIALIVKTYKIHENLGKSVSIEKLIPPTKKFRSPVTGALCQNSSGVMMYQISGNLISPFSGEDGWLLAERHQLMPIDGDDFQREDERQKELAHG